MTRLFWFQVILFFSLLLPAKLLFSVDSGAGLDLWKVAERKKLSLSKAAEELPSPGMVYVGEFHDNKQHHMAQLEVIKALHGLDRPIAVGLEMFQYVEQSVLDAWVNREVSEDFMRQAFARNWNNDWPLYRDIFMFCRDQGIRMLGLNVPRGITRKVARQGFESLTPEEIGKLPPIACRVDKEYEDFLRRVLGQHGGEAVFQKFCEAQLVWDTAMAVYALEFLKEYPDHTVVVLCGMIHAWKPAVPAQLALKAPGVKQAVLQPAVAGRWTKDSTRPVDADYLILGLE